MVPAKSILDIRISFKPNQNINFYKRVYCLVLHEDPFYIDLIGTAYLLGVKISFCLFIRYNDGGRPPDLLQKHIDMSSERALLGFGKVPPEKLEKMTIPPLVREMDQQKSSLQLHNSFPTCFIVLTYCRQKLPTMHLRKSYLIEFYCFLLCLIFDALLREEGNRDEIAIQESFIDFGGCSKDRPSDSQVIHVANRTEGKVTCVWIPPLDDVTK